MERYAIDLVAIQEKCIKTTWYHSTVIQMAEINSVEWWQYQTLIRVWRNRISHTLLREMSSATATLKNTPAVSNN